MVREAPIEGKGTHARVPAIEAAWDTREGRRGQDLWERSQKGCPMRIVVRSWATRTFRWKRGRRTGRVLSRHEGGRGPLHDA